MCLTLMPCSQGHCFFWLSEFLEQIDFSKVQACTKWVGLILFIWDFFSYFGSCINSSCILVRFKTPHAMQNEIFGFPLNAFLRQSQVIFNSVIAVLGRVCPWLLIHVPKTHLHLWQYTKHGLWCKNQLVSWTSPLKFCGPTNMHQYGEEVRLRKGPLPACLAAQKSVVAIEPAGSKVSIHQSKEISLTVLSIPHLIVTYHPIKQLDPNELKFLIHQAICCWVTTLLSPNCLSNFSLDREIIKFQFLGASAQHRKYKDNRQPCASSRALQYAIDMGKKSPTSKRLRKFFADSPKIVIQLRGTFLLDSFPELESKNLIPPWRICSKDKECQNQTDLLDKRLMGKDHR